MLPASRYHRQAAQAAEAAHCALEQGNDWRYHDVLYAGGNAPDSARARARGARPTSNRRACRRGVQPTAVMRKDVTADVAVAEVARRVDRGRACVRRTARRQPDVRASDLVPSIEANAATLETAIAAARRPPRSAATVPFSFDTCSCPTTWAGAGAARPSVGAGARCRSSGRVNRRDRHCRTAHRRRWNRTDCEMAGRKRLGFELGIRQRRRRLRWTIWWTQYRPTASADSSHVRP